MIIKKELILENKIGLNLNELVENTLNNNGIKNGLLYLNISSSTALLTLTNTFDNRTYDDLVDSLDKNCPTLVKYNTNISPFDSSGKIKSSLIGNRLVLCVKEGKCILGSSQAIVALETNGPKKVLLEICFIEKETISKGQVEIRTEQHSIIDATESINKYLMEKEIKNGWVYLFVPHSTAGLWLTENSSNFKDEALHTLDNMVPEVATFKHRETPEDAAGHIKTSITGVYLLLGVTNGRCVIGEDQSIYFLEYDGPRNRKIQIMTDK